MRRRPILIAIFAVVLANAQAADAIWDPANFWVERFGGTGVDQAYSVAVDASGYIYVCGAFEGSVSFGGATFTSVGGANDIFLAKYTPTGAHVWSKGMGTTGNDYAKSVAIDPTGNVVITGQFTGSMSFGGSTLIANGTDVFIAKYLPTGLHTWSQRQGGGDVDRGASIATDAAGNITVIGMFRSSTASFGGANLTNASAGGTYDLFLAQYNSAGVHQWSQRFGGVNDETAVGIETDASGNVYTAGYFFGNAGFGGSTFVNAGSTDIFLAKYNSAGVHQWSRQFGNSSQNEVRGLDVSSTGLVAITGFSFLTPFNLGGADLGNGGGGDCFLACYNASGTHLWSRDFGGTAYDGGLSVAVDGSSNVYLGAYSQGGTPYFGGADYFFNHHGNGDIVIGKYDVNGTHIWSGLYGGNADDDIIALAPDGSNSIVAAGYFDNTVDFGGTELSTAGTYDVFLAKYGARMADPDITSVKDVGNDQGRKVKVKFTRSGGDDVAATMTPVTEYVIFRRDDAPPQMTTSAKFFDSGWTEVGSVHAFGTSAYGVDVPTIGDSTIALGQYQSVFKVRAVTRKPALFYTSQPDSGYSLDNLAPGIPSSFAFLTGNLTWDESTADDFDYFTVYGSNTNSFGAAVVVNYTVAPVMDVSASPYVYYYVTATDFSGNEGKPAKVNTLSNAGEAPRSYVLSVSNYPNPFNPRTTVNYTVPSHGRVSVTVYDAHGVNVATLFDGERDAGAYTAVWDGRANSGVSAASGIYFARIVHNGSTRTKKMVLLK